VSLQRTRIRAVSDLHDGMEASPEHGANRQVDGVITSPARSIDIGFV
jgi:hypothetical protein